VPTCPTMNGAMPPWTRAWCAGLDASTQNAYHFTYPSFLPAQTHLPVRTG
jgi:hypothetical protein